MSYTSACPSCGKVRTLTRPPEKEGQRCSGCANRRYPDGQTCAELDCETTEGLRRGLCGPHYMQAWTAANPRPRPKPIDWEARAWANFWRQVEKTEDCWLWAGHTATNGYGRVGFLKRFRAAHRLPWEAANGPVPAGLELDHLCRNRLCVNPDHLEAVTHAENMRRGHFGMKTHCSQGHPYAGENLRITTARAGRQCRICQKASQARYRARKRAANGEIVGSGESHPWRGDAIAAAERHHPKIEVEE